MKKNFQPNFETVLNIAKKYSIDTAKIENAMSEIPDFRVTVPLVGGFSTGKSSLINAALEEKLLSTDITPETAVPTELVLGNDTAEIISLDDSKSSMPLAEFDPKTLNVEKYKLVKLGLSAPLFKEIPCVKLVDMPGFDSGIEFHNRAIDDYLPNSLAYILAVSATDGTLRESVLSFLNELKIHNVPVYTVITKSGSVLPEEIENIKEHLSDTIRRFLAIEDVKIAVTESKGKKANVDEFEEILAEIQNQSDDIFNRYFDTKLLDCCLTAEKFISDRLKQSDMSLDDLQHEKEQQTRELENLDRNLSHEKESLTRQLDGIVAVLQSKLSQNLNAASNTMENMLLQNQDITEKVNAIARTTVASVIQTEVEPKIKKYIATVSEMINVSVYGNDVQLSEFQKNQLSRAEDFVNGSITPLASAAGAAIGGLLGTSIGSTAIGTLFGAAAGPLGIAIGAAIGGLISFAASSVVDAVKEKQRKEKAHNAVMQVIDSALTEVTNSFQALMSSNLDEISNAFAKEIEEKRTLIMQSIAQSEQKLFDSTRKKEEETSQLNADLEELRGIRNGIG